MISFVKKKEFVSSELLAGFWFYNIFVSIMHVLCCSSIKAL